MFIMCVPSLSLSQSFSSRVLIVGPYLIRGYPRCSQTIVISFMVVPCVHILSLSHPWLACVCIVYHYLIRGFLCASIIFISFIFKRVCVQSLSLSQSLLIQCVNSRSLSLSQLPCMFISYRSLIHGYHVCVHSRCYHFMVILCLQRFVLSHSYFSRVFIIYRYLIHVYPVSSQFINVPFSGIILLIVFCYQIADFRYVLRLSSSSSREFRVFSGVAKAVTTGTVHEFLPFSTLKKKLPTPSKLQICCPPPSRLNDGGGGGGSPGADGILRIPSPFTTPLYVFIICLFFHIHITSNPTYQFICCYSNIFKFECS